MRRQIIPTTPSTNSIGNPRSFWTLIHTSVLLS
nr:MAG TPA: hypothetical protein [Caudoviricetes sp.]